MRVRVAGLAAALLVIVTPAAATATDVDPAAPVVVDDTVLTWPGDTTYVDVLANDTDPGGDDLAICLFPTQHLDDRSDVWVYDLSTSPFNDGSEVGKLQVSVDKHAHGTYSIDYYTCSSTRLTPATLTIVVQDPQPVTVQPADRPGFLSVTNPNDVKIRVDTSGPRWCGYASRTVPAHATRDLRVHHSVIHWSATIGSSASAGHGTVRDIPLRKADADIGLWCRSHVGRASRRAGETDGPVDPTAPVVTNDEITMWPGGSAVIDVLANDADPTGDELAPCRLPSYLKPGGRTRPAAVRSDPFGELPPGSLVVDTGPHATGVHEVHYYVCSHTRLSEATLTVTVREVAPVDVVPSDGRPGFIEVTNHNDVRVLFFATDRSGCRVHANKFVGPGASKTFAVTDHLVRWLAVVGDETSVGIIDHGSLHQVPLDGPAAKPIRGRICTYAWGFGRQAGGPPGIGASGS